MILGFPGGPCIIMRVLIQGRQREIHRENMLQKKQRP